MFDGSSHVFCIIFSTFFLCKNPMYCHGQNPADVRQVTWRRPRAGCSRPRANPTPHGGVVRTGPHHLVTAKLVKLNGNFTHPSQDDDFMGIPGKNDRKS